MDNITPLFPGRTIAVNMPDIPENLPYDTFSSEECQKVLLDWLDMAKEGKLRYVCVAAVINVDGENKPATSYFSGEDLISCLGAIEILKARMIKEEIVL